MVRPSFAPSSFAPLFDQFRRPGLHFIKSKFAKSPSTIKHPAPNSEIRKIDFFADQNTFLGNSLKALKGLTHHKLAPGAELTVQGADR